MNASLKRFLPLGGLLVVLMMAYLLDVPQYLTLDALQNHHAALKAYIHDHLVVSLLGVGTVYIIVTATSIPGATILTLACGLFFGVGVGASLAIVAATIGATLVFLAAQSAFSDFFYQKVKSKLPKIVKGFEENAFSYLLFLRLVPLFPFFVVNIAPAFMNVRLSTYITATLLGIIPGTVVYASIGHSLESLFALGQQPDLKILFKKEIILPLLGLAVLSLLPIFWTKSRNGANK